MPLAMEVVDVSSAAGQPACRFASSKQSCRLRRVGASPKLHPQAFNCTPAKCRVDRRVGLQDRRNEIQRFRAHATPADRMNVRLMRTLGLHGTDAA